MKLTNLLKPRASKEALREVAERQKKIEARLKRVETCLSRLEKYFRISKDQLEGDGSWKPTALGEPPTTRDEIAPQVEQSIRGLWEELEMLHRRIDSGRPRNE